ncbi:MAG TPA: class II aldolase/adducin family protein [Noviherbaspirillum sp.]|nr:class II aldolase/adducin family protein [Noviherbaspirillum sp.]
MDKALHELGEELALAHHILIDQGVLEAFGHASARLPGDPGRFMLPAAGAPSRMRAADMLVFGMDGEPVAPTERALFSERFIHAAIYRARPDVMAICHHHSPSIMPFCVSGVPLRPVSQTGASMGPQVPFWDSRSEFGDTKLLVTTDAEADSLARALGPAWMVLMRRHGATVVGTSVKELVFRAVHYCRDADHQLRAAALGTIDPLTRAECSLAGQLRAEPVARCWEHWKALLPAQLIERLTGTAE